MNKPRPLLTPTITRFEMIFGLIYLPIHVFGLPLLLSALFPEMSVLNGNLIYMGISLGVVAIFYHKMLRREFDTLYDHPFLCLGTLIKGYGLWFALSMVMVLIMSALGVGEDTPNDVAIDELAQEAYGATMMMSVIIAPILEETLFRGVLFQSLLKKGRVLAYVVNILVFGFIHVWQYAVAYQDASYLLFLFQYVPVSFALVWVYDRSGSLWTAIFFHMSNNYLAMKLAELL